MRFFPFVTTLTTGPVATYKTSYCQSPALKMRRAAGLSIRTQTLPSKGVLSWWVESSKVSCYFLSPTKLGMLFFPKKKNFKSTLIGMAGLWHTKSAGFLFPNHRCPCVAARIRLMSTADLKNQVATFGQKRNTPFMALKTKEARILRHIQRIFPCLVRLMLSYFF